MTIRPLTLTVAAAIVAASSLAACGGGSDDADAGTDTVAVTGTGAVPEGDPVATVAIPEGATLCGVYLEEYKPILDTPIAFGEDGWEAEAAELVRISTIMAQLAPEEQRADADDNVRYFVALAEVSSADRYIEGSNAFNLYAIETCLAAPANTAGDS